MPQSVEKGAENTVGKTASPASFMWWPSSGLKTWRGGSSTEEVGLRACLLCPVCLCKSLSTTRATRSIFSFLLSRPCSASVASECCRAGWPRLDLGYHGWYQKDSTAQCNGDVVWTRWASSAAILAVTTQLSLLEGHGRGHTRYVSWQLYRSITI
jgi:hypothetical protein